MATDTIRVLLLEDDPGDVRLLQLMLEQVAPGEFALTSVPRLGEALKLLGKGGFDLVLSDLDVPDSRGLGTFVQISGQAPGVPVVVMTGLADETVAIQAVHKGAQDYLVKGQANGTLVVRSLRYALERHKRQKEQSKTRAAKGKVLAFLGAKGGVGTTTVAVNVAAALTRAKKRVILVELRPWFGTLALHLRRSPPIANLRHALELGASGFNQKELSAHLSASVADLRVLYGPQKPEEFGEVEPGQAAGLLDELASMADYVVLDLPCVPSAASEIAARRSHYVTLVVERDLACLAAGKMVVEVLRGWDVNEGRVGAVVVNRVAASMPLKVADVRSALGCDAIGIVPPAVDACALAQQASSPLVLSQAPHAAALALVDLAVTLVKDPVPAVRSG